MKEPTENIFIVDDRIWKSVARDTVTIGSLLGSVFIGWAIGSMALQWVGAIIWMLWVVGRATNLAKGSRMTIPQARAFLDKLEKAET